MFRNDAKVNQVCFLAWSILELVHCPQNVLKSQKSANNPHQAHASYYLIKLVAIPVACWNRPQPSCSEGLTQPDHQEVHPFFLPPSNGVWSIQSWRQQQHFLQNFLICAECCCSSRAESNNDLRKFLMNWGVLLLYSQLAHLRAEVATWAGECHRRASCEAWKNCTSRAMQSWSGFFP